MIGRVLKRGSNLAGLLYYLYGPGKACEHVNPRLVSGWRHPAELEPSRRAGRAPFAARREQLRRRYHYDRADDAPARGTVATRPRSVPGSSRPALAHPRETTARTAPEPPRWWTDAVEAAVRAVAEHERNQFSVLASHPGRVTPRSTRR
jgi:hypothetical protein